MRSPWIFIFALILQGAICILLWWNGFPRYTADAVLHKQPGVMRNFTGKFSVPSYDGNLPHTEDVFSYPTPVLMYGTFLWVRLFGFSYSTVLAFDLIVHFAVAALAGWIVFRLTRLSTLAAALQLGSLYLIEPVGRPEELGILWFLMAFAALLSDKKHYAVATFMLALCGATSAGAAVPGTLVCLGLDGLTSRFSKRFWIRCLLMGSLATLGAIAIFFWFMSPYIAEGIEQLRYHIKHFYLSVTFKSVLMTQPLWAVFYCLTVLLGAVFGSMILLRLWRSRSLPETKIQFASIALLLGLIVGITGSITSGRLIYDYRWTGIAAMILLCLEIAQLFADNESQLGWHGVAWVCVTVFLFALPNQNIARYLLASFCRQSDHVTYSEAASKVNEIVPSTASLGGDAALWAIRNEGQPYYAIRWTHPDRWPEYLVTTTWASRPYIFAEPEWRERIQKDYQELGTATSVPPEGCACNLLGLRIPFTRGRSDWAVRIWRRVDVNSQLK